MKRDLKKEILLTAEQLFHESGFQAVSMRNIAEALDISVGNLTYHYKRKEDLMKAVMKMHHEKCKALPPPSTLPELDHFFCDLIEKRQDMMILDAWRRQNATGTQELELLAVAHIGELLSGALIALETAGLLRRDPARGAVEQALLGMLLLGRPEELLRGVPQMEETRRCLWQLLSLLLTPKGKDALETINLPF